MIIIPEITIVDSIMGSGKTQSMIAKMNLEKDKCYLFVTPYRTEIDRIVKECGFKTPAKGNAHRQMISNLNDLLMVGENVVMTHSLFLMANAATHQNIIYNEYVLILDESLDVLHSYNDDMKKNQKKIMDADDPQWLLDNGFIEVDDKYNVSWIKEDKTRDIHFSEVKNLASRGMLRFINGKFYWEYPPDIFRWFSDVYVLTYLFDNTILDCYFKQHNLVYKKVSAEAFDGGHHLCEFSDGKNQRQEYASLINLYNGPYNDIGAKWNSFSINWLKGCKTSKINEIKRVMRNYKDSVHATSDSVMWTTTKQFKINEKLESNGGFKFVRRLTAEEKQLPVKELNKLRQFVPCNARATNDFADRTTLMYMLNFNMHPDMEQYFRARGYSLDLDQISLSVLLQWIWRSAIRNKRNINLFVPSSRMRKLLCQWLGIKPF